MRRLRASYWGSMRRMQERRERQAKVLIGARCDACRNVLRDKQKSSTLLDKNIFPGKKSSLSDKVLARNGSNPLHPLPAPTPPRRPATESSSASILDHGLKKTSRPMPSSAALASAAADECMGAGRSTASQGSQDQQRFLNKLCGPYFAQRN